jgi:CheY-like chemotaxis protein
MWFWERLHRARPNDTRIVQPLDGRRILLVDDSYDQQRLMATLLTRAGASVDLECNGQAALETLSRQTGVYDAVVCDFLMPILDGQETTRQMREMGAPLPTIGVTANGDPAVHRAWLACGCDVVLEKPLHAMNFVMTVADAIARRQLA